MRIDRRKVTDSMRELTRFTVTEDHLKLLRRMYVEWDDCETGAPAINPKRPYGNSDVAGDVADILGWDTPSEDGGTLKWESQWEAISARAAKVHSETALALQVCLRAGKFVAGEYRRKDWLSEWESVAPPASTG